MVFSTIELLAALPRLRRYARFLTDDPDRADALVEKTLARARQIRDARPSQATLPAVLLAMLRAVYAEEWAQARDQGPVASPHPDDSPPAEHALGHGFLAQLLSLPLEQREVVVLVAVEQMSYDEVATLLDVPVATVIARLSHARESLRSGAAEPLAKPKSAN